MEITQLFPLIQPQEFPTWMNHLVDFDTCTKRSTQQPIRCCDFAEVLALSWREINIYHDINHMSRLHDTRTGLAMEEMYINSFPQWNIKLFFSRVYNTEKESSMNEMYINSFPQWNVKHIFFSTQEKNHQWTKCT